MSELIFYTNPMSRGRIARWMLEEVGAPLMIHLPEKDARVAQTVTPWVAALKAAGKPVEAFTYPGVDHAFNNDTSAARYDKTAADLAWGRTTAFLHRYLDR